MPKFKTPRFKPLRNSRILKLRALGFSNREATLITQPRRTASGKRISSSFKFTRDGKPVPATADMIRHRQELISQAKATGERLSDVIARDYQDNQWVDDFGGPDVWGMYRHYLDLSPGGPRTKRPGPIDKGNVKAQKDRWRERQRQRKASGEAPASGDPRQWLQELRATIGRTTDPVRRSQFEAQAARLEARIS